MIYVSSFVSFSFLLKNILINSDHVFLFMVPMKLHCNKSSFSNGPNKNQKTLVQSSIGHVGYICYVEGNVLLKKSRIYCQLEPT